jgi:NAD(P)-dependent dehydrogenase (short-subunit alcohol dehydrogenase family)
MGNLDGRVALVTGGGRGIGRAIALALAADGAAVAVTGRNTANLDQVRGEIARLGVPALALACDVTDSGEVRAACTEARAELGPIDILVNNAGVTFSKKFTETGDDEWERVIQTNVNGPFYFCHAVVPDMIARQWGRIINIASIAALVGIPFSSAYGASKHALLGMTRALALEFARYGITVNAVCPGWVETDMLQYSVDNIVAKTGRSADSARAELLRLGGQSRVVTPDEVAATVLQFARPDASGRTGEAVVLP